jgi:hypothetical protein
MTFSSKSVTGEHGERSQEPLIPAVNLLSISHIRVCSDPLTQVQDDDHRREAKESFSLDHSSQP